MVRQKRNNGRWLRHTLRSVGGVGARPRRGAGLGPERVVHDSRHRERRAGCGDAGRHRDDHQSSHAEGTGRGGDGGRRQLSRGRAARRPVQDCLRARRFQVLCAGRFSLDDRVRRPRRCDDERRRAGGDDHGHRRQPGGRHDVDHDQRQPDVRDTRIGAGRPRVAAVVRDDARRDDQPRRRGRQLDGRARGRRELRPDRQREDSDRRHRYRRRDELRAST